MQPALSVSLGQGARATVQPEDGQNGELGAGVGSVEEAKPKGFLVIRQVGAVHLLCVRRCCRRWNKPPSCVQANERKSGHVVVGCRGD